MYTTSMHWHCRLRVLLVPLLLAPHPRQGSEEDCTAREWARSIATDDNKRALPAVTAALRFSMPLLVVFA